MDTLSHTVLGAVIGEAMLGKKAGKKAMFLGAAANNLPDIDVFFAPFFHPADALFIHRGITHSFLFVILMAPFLGWVFTKSFRSSIASFYDWTRMFLLCILAHPILDSFTVYGTGVFEPFIDYRIQFTSLFIIDPLYTLPLLAAFIALLVLKKDSSRRKSWSNIGLIFSTLYLILSVYNKLYVGKIFTDSLKDQKIHYSDYTTSPTPLNNVLWNIVAKDTHGLWTGYYSHFDRTKKIKFSFIPRNDSLARDLINNYTVRNLIRFSRGYYCFTKKDSMIHINDLRFAFAGDFEGHSNNFVFSFGLKKDHSAPYGVRINRNSWSSSRFKGFLKLVERMRGI